LFILSRFVGRSSHLIGQLLNELLLFLTLNISSQSLYAQLLHFKWEIPEILRGCLLSYEDSHIATDIFRTIFEGVISLFDFHHRRLHSHSSYILSGKLSRLGYGMVFNATLNNISVISLQSVFLVEETRLPGENHRPAASH